VKLFPSEEHLLAGLGEMRAALGERYAPVSADIPLLSNLSVFQNIALIRQYHDRIEADEAQRTTTELLERFDLCRLTTRRPYELGDWDLFLVKLLRASQRATAAVVIDRPFSQVGELPSITPIRKALELLDFPGVEAIIVGYEWNRARYEADGE